MNKNTDFEEQVVNIQREINKWKDKQKLLAAHKKEEDINFKCKFD